MTFFIYMSYISPDLFNAGTELVNKQKNQKP